MIRISDVRLAEWMDQVAESLAAGMTPVAALSLARPLPEQGSETMAAAFASGSSWAQALAGSALPLSVSEESILEAAAFSGALPAALSRLAEARRERAATRRQLLRSLLYPAFLLHFAAFAFAVPYLMDGPPHGFAVAAGRILVPLWALAALVAMALRVWPHCLRRVGRFLPFFATYRIFADMAALCDTLATALKSGMPIGAAWEAGLVAADHPRVRRTGFAALQAIERGDPASAAFGVVNGGGLPGPFQQLYRSGEATGNLDQNLAAAGARYAGDARSKLKLATLVYSNLVLVGVFGYVAFRILAYFQSYYQQILDMANG